MRMWLVPTRFMCRIQSIILLIVLLVLFGIAGGMDADEADRQQKQYCEMVKLWKESGGEKGWPAHNGEEQCK